MKIPRELPQFKDENAFIIVTGKQDAAFYKASDGIIEKVDAFKIPRPTYSDNEGIYRTKGRGVATSSGSAKELQDENVIRDFLREFKKRIRKISDFSTIYIFSPHQIKNRVRAALPNEWKMKVGALIEGNYYFRHPTFILKKLGETEMMPFSFPGSEARQIMRKFKS